MFVFLVQFDNSVLELKQYVMAEGVDVSECSKMTQSVRQAIMATIANSSACIVQKIEDGKALVVDLMLISKEALVELDQIKQDGSACLKNIDGTKATVSATASATACEGKFVAKASWMVTKKMPFIAWDLTKITTLLSTLQPSLSSCMTQNAALRIAQETTTVLGSFKGCVMQKITSESVGAFKEKIQFIGNSDLPDVIGGHVGKISNVVGGHVTKIPEVVGKNINKIPEVIGGHANKIPNTIGEYADKLPLFG